MTRILPLLTMIALAILLTLISFCNPYYLSDSNAFLKDFVNHEFLSILGFIVALTLGSAANLHLELNKIEDKTGRAFKRTRKAIRNSAHSLVIAFMAAVALVIFKPLLITEPIYSAAANSVAILIVFFNLAILYDLTEAIFGIPTVKKIKEIRGDNA